MSLDSKNILRVDLPEIYDAIKRRVAYHLSARKDLHFDDFGITEQETQELHDIVMDGCTHIADNCHMVKHVDQTGIDALTYYEILETKEDENGDGVITDPEDQEISTDSVTNTEHLPGQKLDPNTMTYQLFEIPGLVDEQLRYTVVQRFIRKAIISYALKEWWMIKSQYDWARIYEAQFENDLESVRYNTITSHNDKGKRIPLNGLGF